MRIAFFGGSFDPPHRGHLAIAHAALERLHLDEVWFAPVGRQPLKQAIAAAPYADRVRMVQLAIANNPRFCLSLADAPRPDGQPNYMYDTLREVLASAAAGARIFCLLGADSFLMLRKWYRSAELLTLTDFIIAGRPGCSLAEEVSALPDGVFASAPQPCGSQLPVEPSNSPQPGCLVRRLTGPGGASSSLYLLPDLQEDVSATEIRLAIAGTSATRSPVLAAPLAPAVLAYIREQQLYV